MLRGEDTPTSDVDLLVKFEEGQTPGLLGMAQLELELGAALGREVELRTYEDLSRYFPEGVPTWGRRRATRAAGGSAVPPNAKPRDIDQVKISESFKVGREGTRTWGMSPTSCHYEQGSAQCGEVSHRVAVDDDEVGAVAVTESADPIGEAETCG